MNICRNKMTEVHSLLKGNAMRFSFTIQYIYGKLPPSFFGDINTAHLPLLPSLVNLFLSLLLFTLSKRLLLLMRWRIMIFCNT